MARILGRVAPLAGWAISELSNRNFIRSRENPKTLIKIRNFTPLGISQHKPDAILKKIILTLQAASARTHFRGGVMGSNADFMENCLKPKEYAYPSDSSKIKNRHETFITPTKSHENKTPRVFFHPASIGDGPRPPWSPLNHQKPEFE